MLSAGRKLLEKTRGDSQRRLLNVFGKQPRFVRVWRDGMEVETPLERLRRGDSVGVTTGEAVPVDGKVVEGIAMIDQHTLTGESRRPKGRGGHGLRLHVMIAGKVRVG